MLSMRVTSFYVLRKTASLHSGGYEFSGSPVDTTPPSVVLQPSYYPPCDADRAHMIQEVMSVIYIFPHWSRAWFPSRVPLVQSVRALPGCSVTMANTEQGHATTHRKLDQRARRMISSMVIKFLDVKDIAKSYKGTLTQNDLGKYKPSPFTLAANAIAGDPDLCKDFGRQDAENIRSLCHYWFWQDAGDAERMSLADRPRMTKGDYGLSDEDCFFMGDLLVTMEWEDSYGNGRQFTGLDEILLHCRSRATADDSTPEARERAQHRTEHLEDIKSRASGLANSSLNTLLDHVCAKCRCVPARPASDTTASRMPVAILSTRRRHTHALMYACRLCSLALRAHGQDFNMGAG